MHWQLSRNHTAGYSKVSSEQLTEFLFYRSGELVSRFVRLSDTLGEDFYASDLESFLIENGVLSDAKLMPSIIRSSQRDSDQDSDKNQFYV